MKRFVIIFFLALFTHNIHAQQPETFNSADVLMNLKKLNVLGSVLYIAAHPDDENTRLLTYLSREKLYRTGYLSLTRGDGGQNLIGKEQGIELGLIRTQELLAARRIDGAEQFFTRAYDFGYSKSSAEAIDTWGHDKILSDIVWVIRKFRPDVIITRFPGDERAGHGHHAASSILANEAFIAAADNTKFPEQFKYGVEPWQAKRILWNTYNFGANNTIDSTQLKVDVGVYNNLLGKSYGEISSESRSQHKSQGFGVPRQRGQSFEYFNTTGGSLPKDSLLHGVKNSWSRVRGGDHIQQQIDVLIARYNFEHPEKMVQQLVQLYKAVEKIDDAFWRNIKLEEIKQLIAQSSGLFAEATTGNEYAVQGDSLKIQFFVNIRNVVNATLKKISLEQVDSTFNLPLEANVNHSFNKTIYVAQTKSISQPYWITGKNVNGSFTVNDQQLIGKAENDAAYTAHFTIDFFGTKLTFEKPVKYKTTDPVKGELYQPLRVVPSVTAMLDQPVYIISQGLQKPINLMVHARLKTDSLSIQLSSSGKLNLSPASFSTSLNQVTSQTFKSVVTDASVASTDLSVDALENGKTIQLFEEHIITYDHIPGILYYSPVKARVEKLDIITKGKTIGYIEGAGDKVPQALQQMGYEVTLLQQKDLTDANLKSYDAIITGVRAYNVHEWLNEVYDVLMRYISNGGNLIVQYNTSNYLSTVSGDRIGPYNFSVGRTRVTDENAEVKILQPQSPALNYPNKISAEDFSGWIQERSIYQAENLDDHFSAPIAMNDAGESASNGSLVIAKYGKGNFVYTGLVFFRQLPAGVPGAYRLMANLIGLQPN